MSEPMTVAGKRLLEAGYDFCELAFSDQLAYVHAIEAEAVAAERDRIIREVRPSRDSRPIFNHVDAYSLGQVLKGKPWPAPRA